MTHKSARLNPILLLITTVFAACNPAPTPTIRPHQSAPPIELAPEATLTELALKATLTPTASPEPPRVLTICMGREPTSLFLYGDSSLSSRSIRQAIYDGPLDTWAFGLSPVILEKTPDLADGSAALEPTQVITGSLIIDAQGNLATLKEGVTFLPAGCQEASCDQTYSGQADTAMDQLVANFKLKEDIRWSDGVGLTADDSVYSYEVAKSLFPRFRPDLLSRTQSYVALDSSTVEWRGIPGYQGSQYPSHFFTPLPRHAWGNISPQDLLSAETPARRPIGWGAYRIDEWTAGDHLTLSKNPNYFRSKEGLPRFDKLVFRFVASADDALIALLAGECDLIDETAQLETQISKLVELQDSGKLTTSFTAGPAWEHLDFGITSLDTALPALFTLKETRQALALCIDRQGIANQLFPGMAQVPDSYILNENPLHNPKTKGYNYDPQSAAKLLQAVGWLDLDNNPATPRRAQGIAGIPDGTPFEFTFLTSREEEKQRTSQAIQASLGKCGIRVNVKAISPEELFEPGPDGPIFGRKFSLAEFGWMISPEPPCSLYTTSEIPGPYPDFPKGWGGANVSGFSSPEFDLACQRAQTALPDTPDYPEAHRQAQAIFAQELPAIPLYFRPRVVAMRPDLCGVSFDPSVDSVLWNLESFNYGKECPK